MSEPITAPSTTLHKAGPEEPAEQLRRLWCEGQAPDVHAFLARTGDLPPAQFVEVLLADQRQRRQLGEVVRAEEYLGRYPALRADADSALELVYGEFLLREEWGEQPTLEEYARRFPDHAVPLRVQLDLHRALPAEPEPDEADPTGAGGPGTQPAVPGYVILGELGRGGMGVVYQARQISLNRVVALKMILAGPHADADLLRRFRAEAAAVARLRHPNIIQVHDHGHSAGHAYLALEYVEGGTLTLKAAGVPQPPEYAAQVVETLAAAVHYAHGQGLVHRDLKPANVLVTAEGVLKIADFGLAKWLHDTPGGDAAGAATRTGVPVGTPAYMAPEQTAGSRDIGPAADVYALGVILYQLLTGRLPFLADGEHELFRQVREETPVSLRRLRPGVPRDLETICLKCLAKEPAKRYASAAALAEDLRRFQAGEPIRARPVRLPERAWRWAKRRPAAAALLLLAALSLVGFGSVRYYIWVLRKTHAEELRNTLFTVETANLSPVVQRLQEYLPFVAEGLRLIVADEGSDPGKRLRAALVLARSDEPSARYLQQRPPEATPAELGLICDALQERREECIAGWTILLRDLGETPSEKATEVEKERNARSQANLALALMRLGDPGPVLDRLRERPDPRLRYHLVHGMGPCGVAPAALAEGLRVTRDDSVRSALLLALGDYAWEAIPISLRAELKERGIRLYREDPDAGVHSAAGWLLGRWDLKAPPVTQSLEQAVAQGSQWYTTKAGHTLAIIRPAGAAGPIQPFAIATTEVTVDQFLRFKPEHSFKRDFSPEGSCPVNDVTFFNAALYCNWLSAQEGLPPGEHCYDVFVAEQPQDWKLISASYDRLGYRLPTEVEWEYACRANTRTLRFFGESSEYLSRYAWYYSNSQGRSWPVGRLRPNPLGLFDIYGNASEWCARSWKGGAGDTELILGQSARQQADVQRSDGAPVPAPRHYRNSHIGFRVGRTLGDR